MAKFIGVGVGPGDSELLTAKAIRIINESDVLICPSSQELAFCDVSGTLFFRHASTFIEVADNVVRTIDFLIESLP